MTANIVILKCGTLRLVLLMTFLRTTRACATGFFGKDCNMMCHCKGGHQNCVLGICTEGCDKQFIGPLCQY
ncbi:hypothetical protein ElyMa_003641900, partial [Elysia marginata]